MKRNRLWIAAAAGVLLAPAGYAGEIADLTVFTAGTKAVAAEVNGNFDAVKLAVNDNDARIAALEALVQTLQATVAAQASTIGDLEEKLAHVSFVTHNGQPTVRFSGVNVQIVNGEGVTESVNGTGNLIVGYDEADTSAIYRCTIGWDDMTSTPVTDQTTCEAAGAAWTNRGFKTGSHYIVAGTQNNYSRFGGVVLGYGNTSNYDHANVTAGFQNTASGPSASVSGGYRNTASGRFASVSGGGSGAATNTWASVSGGYSGVASGTYASVIGGRQNTASGPAASVSGGVENEASNDGASVSGGWGNTASGSAGNVSGGLENTASGAFSSVSGGNGCNSGASNFKWAVGQTSTSGCHTTLGN